MIRVPTTRQRHISLELYEIMLSTVYDIPTTNKHRLHTLFSCVHDLNITFYAPSSVQSI